MLDPVLAEVEPDLFNQELWGQGLSDILLPDPLQGAFGDFMGGYGGIPDWFDP